MLWSSLHHFPLHCSPHTSEIRDFASCQGSVQVTVSTLMELIPLFTQDVRSRTIVWSTFLRTRPRKPKLGLVHESQRTRSRKAPLSCSNFFPRMPVVLESPKYASNQSVRGSETFRGEAPDCRIGPRSPSTHRRQETATNSRGAFPSPHTAFRESYRRSLRDVHGTRDFVKCPCVNSLCVLHIVPISLQERRLGVSTFQLCVDGCWQA